MTMTVLSGSAITARPWLLAIDTSTERAGLALFDGLRMSELSWHAGRTQTVSVLPRIVELLNSFDLDIGDIGAVGIARGPGTFTGLRVGLSIAKGMMIGAERALVAIDTLNITAAPWLAAGSSVLAVLPAGRQRLVWAVYAPGAVVSGARNTTLAQLLDYLAIHPELLVAGELLTEQRATIEESHEKVVTAEAGARRPGVLAELAWSRWRRGDHDDPITIEPFYLHGKALGGSTGH